MPHRCYLALGLLIAQNVSIAAAPTAVLEMDAEGEVQIAPDGHVSDYRLTSELAPAVARLVDRNVRDWQFEPVLVDGRPVLAKTRMHLRLRAEAAEAGSEQFRVRVLHVGFGGPSHALKMQPPRYPEPAVRAHLGARVLLALKVDERGNIAEVQPYQTSLDARASSEQEAERWRHLFEQASVAAARRWHYDIAEAIDGKPIGTNLIVPLEFAVYDRAPPPSNDGRWKAYAPGPLHPAPWMNPALATSDLSALRNGEVRTLDSPFHLKNDVVGSLL